MQSAELQSFVETLSSLDGDSFSNDTERFMALNALARLTGRLERPWETGLKLGWMMPAFTACLKIGVDLDLFHKWDELGPGAKTSKQLAAMTNADPFFLARILRHLAGMHALEELAEDTYELTPFTKALAKPGVMDILPFLFAVNGPGFMNLPAFCQSIEYQDPVDPTKSNWQHMTKSNESLFQFLGQHPDTMQHFQQCMGVIAAQKVPWTSLYPLEHLRLKLKSGRPLFVDVGGGYGTDIQRLVDEFPEVPHGTLILQELAEVVKQAKISSTVEAMTHDFFQPQPVKGAAVYYLHTVLHDWPDDKALQILKHLAEAMEPGYSSVLLHESVISAFRADPRVCTSDLTMMMSFSAAERTEVMWKGLIESAGLKLVKTWAQPTSPESILELEKESA